MYLHITPRGRNAFERIAAITFALVLIWFALWNLGRILDKQYPSEDDAARSAKQAAATAQKPPSIRPQPSSLARPQAESSSLSKPSSAIENQATSGVSDTTGLAHLRNEGHVNRISEKTASSSSDFVEQPAVSPASQEFNQFPFPSYIYYPFIFCPAQVQVFDDRQQQTEFTPYAIEPDSTMNKESELAHEHKSHYAYHRNDGEQPGSRRYYYNH